MNYPSDGGADVEPTLPDSKESMHGASCVSKDVDAGRIDVVAAHNRKTGMDVEESRQYLTTIGLMAHNEMEGHRHVHMGLAHFETLPLACYMVIAREH
jgi:hypothetical protein